MSIELLFAVFCAQHGRHHAPIMKKAINAWSIPENVTFEEMFSQISKAGYDGIELNIDKEDSSSHSLTLTTDKACLDKISELSKKYSLPVCSISTSLFAPETLGSDDEKCRESGKLIIRKQLEYALALGADGVLVVPGGIGENRSIKRAYENSFESLSSMKSEIAQGHIKVGLENVWNNFFASPVDMKNFIDSLDCKNIGAYFDVGNVMIFSHPEHWIEILGSRIMKIHLKDFIRTSGNAGTFVNLLEGSVCWAKVMNALRTAGYDGYLTAEVAALPQSPEYLYESTKLALDKICSM